MNQEKDASGIFVPAGLLIGMGLGFIFNQLVGGLFLGLGVGLLVMAIFKIVSSKQRANKKRN